MQKHYLLLRNNQQSGPFTIDELLQQHLTSSDLVWVEGLSHAWAFPSEIEELRFAAAGAAAAQRGQRHIYVAYPARQPQWMEKKPSETVSQKPETASARPEKPLTSADLDRKAEELRQRALSWKPASYYQAAHEIEQDHVGYASYEQPIQFEYHHKKKYVTLEHLMVVVLITVLAAAGWYRGWLPLRSRINTTEQAVTPLVTLDNHAAKTVSNNQLPAQNSQPLLTVPKTDTLATASDTAAKTAVVQIAKPKSETAKKKTAPKIVAPEIIKPEIVSAPKEEEVLPPAAPPVVTEEKKDPATAANQNGDEAGEKKKHRGFLGGLFKKKKKDGE